MLRFKGSLEHGFCDSWFPSSPSEIRVPFFLLLGFNEGTPKKKKGKRVLLGNLGFVGLHTRVSEDKRGPIPLYYESLYGI